MSQRVANLRLHLKEQVQKTLKHFAKPPKKIKSFIDHSQPIELRKYINDQKYLLKRYNEFVNQQMGRIQQVNRRKNEKKRYSQRKININPQHRDENLNSNFKNDPQYKSFLNMLNSSDLALIRDNKLEKISFQEHKQILEMKKNNLQSDHIRKEANSKFGGPNQVKPEERNSRITQSLNPRDNVREINSVSKNRGYPAPKNTGGTPNSLLNRRHDQAQNRNKNQGYVDIHQNRSGVTRSSKEPQRSQNKTETSISSKNNHMVDEFVPKTETSTKYNQNGFTNNFHPENGLLDQNFLKLDNGIDVDHTKVQNSTNKSRSFIKTNRSPSRPNHTNQNGDKHARNTQPGGLIGTKNMHVDFNPNDTNHLSILENSEKFPVNHSKNQNFISTRPSDTKHNIQGLTKPPQNMKTQALPTQYTPSTQISQERQTPHKVYKSIEEYNKERLEEAIQASSGGYLHNLHLEIHPRLPNQFAGIVNIGNSCYLNSIIQILFYSECFREKILKFRSHFDSSENLKTLFGQYSKMSEGQKLENKKHFFELHGVYLIYSLQNLFSKMIKGKKLYVNPIEIFERIVYEMNLTPFVMGPQNDTVEFLDTFFNCLDAGFRKISQVGKYSIYFL